MIDRSPESLSIINPMELPLAFGACSLIRLSTSRNRSMATDESPKAWSESIHHIETLQRSICNHVWIMQN